MKYFELLKKLYSVILRDLIAKGIENSPSEVDDFLLVILDRIFEYNEQKKLKI